MAEKWIQDMFDFGVFGKATRDELNDALRENLVWDTGSRTGQARIVLHVLKFLHDAGLLGADTRVLSGPESKVPSDSHPRLAEQLIGLLDQARDDEFHALSAHFR